MPLNNRTILAEVFGLKWNDEYDKKDYDPVFDEILKNNEELNNFINRYCGYYTEQRNSWRDFRNFTLIPALKDEGFVEEIEQKIEKEVLEEG